jgi:hypothetical protein
MFQTDYSPIFKMQKAFQNFTVDEKSPRKKEEQQSNLKKPFIPVKLDLLTNAVMSDLITEGNPAGKVDKSLEPEKVKMEELDFDQPKVDPYSRIEMLRQVKIR